MLWKDLLSCDFNAAVEECRGVCAIPIGCMEAHGIHLPLGCDTIKGAEFCKRAAEKENVCVFPEMYFGEKSGAGEYPGTIITPTRLIFDLLENTCREIARNGFHKIVLVTTHGGNRGMIDAFTRYMLQTKPNFLVYHYYQKMPKVADILEEIEKYPYLNESDIKILQDFADSKKTGGHGCFVETGCLYDVCPELISFENMKKLDGASVHRFDGFTKLGIYTPFTFMGNYPNSLSGEYHEGINERIAKALAAKTVEWTEAVFRFLREETVSTEFHKEWLEKQNRNPSW